MPQLSELIANLNSQFLDPHDLILDQAAKTEAFRSSLATINGSLNQRFTIAGLDGALISSLPEEYLPALIRGAAGTALQMVLQHKFASYSNLPLQSEELSAWARYLFQERDDLLDRLRIANLHRASSQPWGQWKLAESNHYD